MPKKLGCSPCKPDDSVWCEGCVVLENLNQALANTNNPDFRPRIVVNQEHEEMPESLIYTPWWGV